MSFRIRAAVGTAGLALMLSACSGTVPSVSVEPGELRDVDALETQLPVTLSFDDRMGSAVVTLLPEPLDVDAATTPTGFRTGDVVYSTAEQSLIIFTRGGSAAGNEGLVLLGRVAEGMSDLGDCIQDCSIQIALSRGGA